jgi:hypothetical protein
MAAQNNLAGVIGRLQPFKASALTGDSDKRHRRTGRLSPEAAALFEARRQEEGTGEWFVVYSYSTPIAWYTDADGWCVIDKSALEGSATTNKHINLVKRALGLR